MWIISLKKFNKKAHKTYPQINVFEDFLNYIFLWILKGCEAGILGGT